ncbi:MAG TPA: hypothetical protein VFY96_03450, partial [Candidatus Binatia bacterium]|nr:hypothetical protein [Candidatus Binatia bacterium]
MQTLGADLRRMQAECDTRNTRLIGHHDLDGSGDHMQIIKVGRYAYVAHVGKSNMALSILDISDPGNPCLVRQIPHPHNTHNHKVQIVGNTLIQNSEYISYLAKTGSEKPVTGLNVYNLDDPTNPKLVGFYPVGMRGVHRIWYREAPHAHIAAPVGRSRGYHIVDLSDPGRPTLVGCWWPPGAKKDDADPWEVLDPAHDKFQVHGAIPYGNRAYVSCTDAGVAILDIADLAAPRLISRINWCPPYGGYAHTALPLPGRGLLIALCEYSPGGRERNGDKRIWVIDIREERQPVIIGSFPEPKPSRNSPWQSFHDRPVRFGPHNLHENYGNGFQSEKFIFSTWFCAGMRVTDISDPDRPVEVGH